MSKDRHTWSEDMIGKNFLPRLNWSRCRSSVLVEFITYTKRQSVDDTHDSIIALIMRSAMKAVGLIDTCT